MRKSDRVRLFLRLLETAPPCATHDEAFALISASLNEVEDAHSGVPFDPNAWKDDGRLYPPQNDQIAWPAEFPGVARYRSVGHWTYIAPNGAFRIVEIAVPGVALIGRSGADGRGIDDYAEGR